MKYLLMTIVLANTFCVSAGNISKIEKYFDQNNTTPYELVVDELEKRFNNDLTVDRLLPDNPDILEHLGDVYSALDKKEEASKCWIKAILLVKDNNKLLHEIKAKLIKLKNK